MDLQVLLDPTGQMAERAVNDGVLLVGDALNQVPIVRHNQQRARPRVEDVLQGGQHIGIDVVGRLVQNHDIGLVKQDEQNLQPAFLPARQFSDAR